MAAPIRIGIRDWEQLSKPGAYDCSGCGRFVKKGLSVRVHSCPGRGLIIDCDINAAKNILNRGWACHPGPA